MLRLRLRAHIALSQAARQTERIRQGVLDALWLDRETVRQRARMRRITAISQSALFKEFEDRYDQLVDLLCWAAKDGIHDGRDARYAELRAWFLKYYRRLQPALTHYLESEPEDRIPAKEGEPAPQDAFESLFLPTDVDALINSETIISRIMRTRCAVDILRENTR
jgi:hypothetical protein